jgi:hypothetical protein
MTQLKKHPAVTIATSPDCCAAASAFKDTRILATQAPTLPVPNCSMPTKCRCRFRKYVDRREDNEGRRFKVGAERGAWYAGGQRRKSRGRRNAD